MHTLEHYTAVFVADFHQRKPAVARDQTRRLDYNLKGIQDSRPSRLLLTQKPALRRLQVLFALEHLLTANEYGRQACGATSNSKLLAE